MYDKNIGNRCSGKGGQTVIDDNELARPEIRVAEIVRKEITIFGGFIGKLPSLLFVLLRIYRSRGEKIGGRASSRMRYQSGRCADATPSPCPCGTALR